MTIEEQPIALARRRRSVLFAGSSGASAGESVLRQTARGLRADVLECESMPELSRLLESERECLCVVVVAHGFPEMLAAARLASLRVPACEVMLVATEEQESELKLRFGILAKFGSHVQFISPDDQGLSKVFRSVFQKAEQRRATRTTLDRFNARISVPVETVDTQELRQLVISDRFLSSILESAFDAVILVDRVGIIAAYNPSAERLFLRSQADAISHPLGSLSVGAWERDTRAVLQATQEGQLIHTSIEREDGVRNVEVAATPVYDRLHNRLATSLILRDVTERLQSEQALRTNEKLAAVGRLASSIAHEINNPLESVTNLLFLARQSTDMAEVQEYLDTADLELRRMTAITNQTLRFHKQSSSPQVVTAEDLLESVLGVYQMRFRSSGVELEKKLRATQGVSCFEGEIRQILNNIVGNALDAMQATGGRLLLRSGEATQWGTGARGLSITMADTGTGMSALMLKKVFNAFYTTKGVRGTGLGLWISAEIVARHRGTLTVRSSQRAGCSGTVFRLFLPFDAVTR